ncbi:ABC transporter permease [Gaopeijia maritima]|uniref:ABC transporter permease n=1 Tax=Gaopeijia maritima TaxID=3119007 RepID=A0ABU9EBA2_9BACT
MKGRWRDRLHPLLGRARVEREVDDEFAAHIEHRVDDLVESGMDPEAARARAEREFGNRSRLRRDTVKAGSGDGASGAGGRAGWFRDVAWAGRQLRRSPGFAAVAGLTLMLGIGAAVTIVSVVRTVVLDPLPFEAPEELLALGTLTPAGDPFSTSEPAFLDWRERLRTVSDVGAYAGRTETLRAPGDPRGIVRGYANAGLLEMLGVEPSIGRAFTAAEDRPGDPVPVALLAHDLWQERFGGAADVVGSTVDVDGRLFEVIGVLPEGLDVLFGGGIDLLTPLAADPGMDRGEHYLDVVARMAPGATETEVLSDLQSVAAWQSDTFEEDRGWSAELEPLDRALLGEATIRAGWVLIAAAGLLLAMACVNVSNLLLARATARKGEMGLRAVLGADRTTLLRQLAVESALLAGIGTALGLAMATVALPLVRRLGAGRLPRLDEAGVDPATAAAACVLAALTVGLFGLAPMVGLRRDSLAAGLRGVGRGSAAGGGGLRRALVTAQVVASVVLLVGTGLLSRSFAKLSSVDPGFETVDRVTLDLAMPDAAYDWQERGPLMQEILRRSGEVPGVEVVGATSVDPFSGYALANFVARRDRMPERAADFTPIHWRVVTPGFFEAMGLEIRAGRGFDQGDLGDDGVPVVVGEGLAERFFGSASEALDRELVWGDHDGSVLRIVGVAERLRDVRIDEESELMVYRAHAMLPWASMTLVARLRPGADPAVASGLREAVRSAAPGLAVPEVRLLETTLDRALAEPRFNLLLMAAFALVGLALAVVGLYGLTAFEVRRSFREIGIRMSLGAESSSLVSGLVARRMMLAGIGMTIGMALAGYASRWLDTLLFEVSPRDPLTWIAVIATVGVTTAVATWIPARWAAAVDPRQVLSAE